RRPACDLRVPIEGVGEAVGADEVVIQFPASDRGAPLRGVGADEIPQLREGVVQEEAVALRRENEWHGHVGHRAELEAGAIVVQGPNLAAITQWLAEDQPKSVKLFSTRHLESGAAVGERIVRRRQRESAGTGATKPHDPVRLAKRQTKRVLVYVDSE